MLEPRRRDSRQPRHSWYLWWWSTRRGLNTAFDDTLPYVKLPITEVWAVSRKWIGYEQKRISSCLQRALRERWWSNSSVATPSNCHLFHLKYCRFLDFDSQPWTVEWSPAILRPGCLPCAGGVCNIGRGYWAVPWPINLPIFYQKNPSLYNKVLDKFGQIRVSPSLCSNPRKLE
jgi:hypothetical protein